MKEINNDFNIIENTSVAIGCFDGVHKGHRLLINCAIKKAKEENFKALVYTFNPHPRKVLDRDFKLIYSPSAAKNLIKELKPNYLFIEKINSDFLNISPKNFIENILFKKLKAKSVTVGENFHFGRGGSGNSEYLKAYLEKKGIACSIIPILEHKGAISSSRIRGLIEEGKVNEANYLLERPFFLKGRVVKGRQDGRKMGFPTANIIPKSEYICPKIGVYAALVKIDNTFFGAVANVGFAPTFSANKLTAEAHIINFNKDIYGKNIEIFFIEKLRDEIRFNLVNELKNQLSLDKAKAETILKEKSLESF